MKKDGFSSPTGDAIRERIAQAYQEPMVTAELRDFSLVSLNHQSVEEVPIGRGFAEAFAQLTPIFALRTQPVSQDGCCPHRL